MLTRSRWITIKPRSSPLYALAAAKDSEKDWMILPSPLAHSSTNAAEHRCGYSWRMYDPSKTATSNLSRMASATHSVPPSINMCSQSHMHPHLCRTSRKEVWGVATGALRTVDITRNTPGCIPSTEHTLPLSCRGRVAIFVYLFDFLTVLEYTSVVSDPRAVCRSVLDSWHHHHGCIRCVSPMYSPTLWTWRRLGQMSSTASRHSEKSKSGSSFGHLMDEWDSPTAHRWSTVGSILSPNADNTSERKIVWR